MKRNEYQICERCVMDTTDLEIEFDNNGICNHCREAEVRFNHEEPLCFDTKRKTNEIQKVVKRIKERGENKRYDCIIGLSGGVDSSYVALKVKELGLRPLAVHLDNGWNSEISVKNIENICKILDIDLYTHVVNWEEFKDLQLSFLKASTPDTEIPTDHAITAILYKIAEKNGLKYIIFGTNIASECINPNSWSQGFYDLKYIKGIQRRYGKYKLKTFPYKSAFGFFIDDFVLKIQRVNLLNYFDYDKEKAKEIIKKELDWKDYGRKHGESHFTRIFQEYILPVKFGYDKRKGHYSSLIMAGQMSRQEALDKLQEPLYSSQDDIEKDLNYLVNKFGISRDDFKDIMRLPPKSYWDYDNYQYKWYYRLALKIYKREMYNKLITKEDLK